MNKADLLKKLESIKAGIDKAPANAKPLMQKAIDNIESQIAELDKEGNVKPEAKAETKTEGRAKAGRPKGTTKPKAEKVKRGRGRPAKKVVEKAPEEKPVTEVQINKVAKDIREEGEPMIRARKRAKKALTEIKEVAKETKQMESKGTLTKSKILAEIKKLNKVFANLGVDIVVESADDLFRDATRTALPKGRRISKNGKEYYESRPNRSDSLQGTAVYPKLKLAKGGIIRYEVKGNDLNEKLDNTRKMKSLIQKAYQTQDPEEDDKYPLNFIMNVALTGEIVKHDGKNYYIDYTFGGVKSYLRFSFLDNKYFLEALTYTNRPAIKKFAEGGMIETGDNVFVIGENKSGVVTNVIANGKHFSVLFADGTKNVYDKAELKKVYSDDDYDDEDYDDYDDEDGDGSEREYLVVCQDRESGEQQEFEVYAEDEEEAREMALSDCDFKNPKIISVERYAKGGEVGKKYMVFNYTDNIYASPEVFNTKKEANEFIKSFKKRFEMQGYYRDNRMNKIDIEDIDLLVIPSDFSPFGKFAKGGMSDISHYKVGDEVFIDYMDAMNYCDKHNLSYSKIIKTKKYANGGGVKYPTDLKVGSVLEGIGFPMLKGLDGGNFYTIVEMDNYSATLVRSDKNGKPKSKLKSRHYLSSLESAIKTASRGDNNGLLVEKYANGGRTYSMPEEKIIS